MDLLQGAEEDAVDEEERDKAQFSIKKNIPIEGVLVDVSDAGLTATASLPTRDITDVNADGNTYYGTAPWGSATTDAVWVIERKDDSGEFTVAAPDQQWSTRTANATYNNGVVA